MQRYTASRGRYPRWLWIELIGFDNGSPDFGVGDLVERCGFVPDGVALLLYNPDFVHAHDGLGAEHTFLPDICCYGGYEATEERERQEWTNHQLHGLVQTLHEAGTKVFPSVFDTYRFEGPWMGAHPEVCHLSRTRGRMRSVCPWKHLADGTLYEDFFIGKLLEVIADYGFDGFFGADGYNPPRIPVYDGDFSDDMVGQFTQAGDVALPASLRGPCGDDAERIEARADWIWQHLRREWIAFQVDRRTSFWRKVVRACHAVGKTVFVNSTWTKDPFESVYRFGVDYRMLAGTGIDGFVLEAAAAALETLTDPGPSARILCGFTAASLLTKARAPDMPMLWLHGVKDTNEDWQAIRQVPMALESEVLTYSHLYTVGPGGECAPCVEGPMVCLADCIKQHEWEWLRHRWDMGLDYRPESVYSATLVCSQRALEREVDDYIATRRWTTHRWLHRLLARGAAIHVVTGLGQLGTLPGTLLVLAAHLWDREELAAVLARDDGPAVVIGGAETAMPDTGYACRDTAVPDGFCAAVYGAPPGWTAGGAQQTGAAPVALPATPGERPLLFYEDLPYRDVSEDFLQRCAQLVNGLALHGVARLSDPSPGLSLWAMRGSAGKLRLLVRNDTFVSIATTVDVQRDIKSAEFLNSTTGKRPTPHGPQVGVRVPARGTALVEVVTDD